MKIHLETHDLPTSNGYSPTDGHITVYCGRCHDDYTADRGWARRYMTRLRRDLDRELDRGYITSRAHAATIEMHEKYFRQADLLREDSEAERERCPGCTADREPERLLCDHCWNRMPAKLPIGPDGSLMTWRRRVMQARKTGDWGDAINIVCAMRTWLDEHPLQTTESDRPEGGDGS